MTINRKFDTVTFWDSKQHKNYVLKGRIKREEKKFLEAFLSPNLTAEERIKIDNLRKQ